MGRWQPVCLRTSFCPAVMERLGTMCDELAGLIRMLCGDGERDRMRHDDVTLSHSSRSTYMAGMIGLAVVVYLSGCG